MKHKFKSIDGAVRRIRELEGQVRERDYVLTLWLHERIALAKLAAYTPQFDNTLDIVEAIRIRDAIMAQIGLTVPGSGVGNAANECGDTLSPKA